MSDLQVVAACLSLDGAGDEGAERRRRLVDWRGPLAIANRHLVTPGIYVNLAAAGRLDELPTEVRDYLTLLYRRNAARNAALRRQVLELIEALKKAGIQPLMLKGSLALFLPHYRTPAARMIGDIDVLVRQGASRDALATLRDLGYRIKTRYPAGHHAYGDFTRPGTAGAIDLHFEILDATYLLPSDEIWERAKPVETAGVAFFVPSPTDCVLHNLLHAQIHYLGNFYRAVQELRQLYEYVAFARHYGDAVDWAFIVRRMAKYRLDVPLQSYTLTASRLFQMPWPLPNRPSTAAAFHVERCLAQLRLPVLAYGNIPWGNLRASFAWHRMNARYQMSEFPGLPLVRHAAQFVQKCGIRSVGRRIFRTR